MKCLALLAAAEYSIVTSQKVWTRPKILNPISYFVAILRYVTIYTLFGNLLANPWALGTILVKISVSKIDFWFGSCCPFQSLSVLGIFSWFCRYQQERLSETLGICGLSEHRGLEIVQKQKRCEIMCIRKLV